MAELTENEIAREIEPVLARVDGVNREGGRVLGLTFDDGGARSVGLVAKHLAEVIVQARNDSGGGR